MTQQRKNSPGVIPNCWACGGNINATDRFCSACGVPSKLYPQVTSQTSSSEFRSDTEFCPKCGGKVINAQVITSTDRSQEPSTMDAGVRNHHVAGPGPIATSTSIALEPVQQSENLRADEHFFAKVAEAREATLTDIKRLVAAAERHIADVQAAATEN